MKSDPTFWILARASGLMAYALLTSSVLAGLVLKARPFGRSLRPATVTDVHRFLALLDNPDPFRSDFRAIRNPRTQASRRGPIPRFKACLFR